MKDDEELEMLLGEIPHAIHHPYNTPNAHHHYQGQGDRIHGSNLTEQKMSGLMMAMGGNGNGNRNGVCLYDDDTLTHKKYTCASPVSGFSLQSDGSSSSLFSGGHSLSDNGSPTPPPLEELKPHLLGGCSKNYNGPRMDLKAADAANGKIMNDNLIDEVMLTKNLSKMYICDQKEVDPVGPNCGPLRDRSVERAAIRMSSEKCMASLNHRNGLYDYGASQTAALRGFQNFEGGMGSAFCYSPGNLSGSQYPPARSDGYICPPNYVDPAMASQYHGTKGHAGHYYPMKFPLPELLPTLGRPSGTDAGLYAQQAGIRPFEERAAFSSPNGSSLVHLRPHFDADNVYNFQYPQTNRRSQVFPQVKVPHRGLEAFTREESLIIQGEGLSCMMNKGYGRPRVHNARTSFQDVGIRRHQEKRSQLDNRSHVAGIQENGKNARMHCPFSLPAKCSSLAEAQGYIYYIAKDQHGCRFLQTMFDEGTPRDVQLIFSEIIDHVVELMMNPFGNYLMQKLLEVCNEEQTMQILLKATQEPGELVRISLNTHGTRVVQKLIETLRTRHQVSLVISALEPGFIALIKDLNGNHVVQRCLQCLSNEDNKFIFVAAAKYCVDIATHQHGCCVLQRCISHSTGEHRDTLVAEISRNGLLLAQDAFGNYVVQFILELNIPSAVSKLVSQFEGSYVHLSTQKFSSHVVEKCLIVCTDQIRSKIIHELLSTSHFDQLLQDPHANYVVQTALRVSEGPLHDLLVEAIESHRAVSRNSPYSKRIFSHKLMKK